MVVFTIEINSPSIERTARHIGSKDLAECFFVKPREWLDMRGTVVRAQCVKSKKAVKTRSKK